MVWVNLYGEITAELELNSLYQAKPNKLGSRYTQIPFMKLREI